MPIEEPQAAFKLLPMLLGIPGRRILFQQFPYVGKHLQQFSLSLLLLGSAAKAGQRVCLAHEWFPFLASPRSRKTLLSRVLHTLLQPSGVKGM